METKLIHMRLLFAIFWACLPCILSAQIVVGNFYTLRYSTELHFAPEKTSDKFLTIPRGDTVLVIEKPSDNYTKVEYKDSSGYIDKSLLIRVVAKDPIEKESKTYSASESGSETAKISSSRNCIPRSIQALF